MKGCFPRKKKNLKYNIRQCDCTNEIETLLQFLRKLQCYLISVHFLFFSLVLFLNVEVCFSCQPEVCYTDFNKNFKKQNAKGTEIVPWYSKAIYTENLLNITPFPTSFQNFNFSVWETKIWRKNKKSRVLMTRLAIRHFQAL